MTTEDLTPRQAWTDAVWASELRPLERLVALVYAKFAGNGTESVWVDRATLRAHSGMSLNAINRALRGLEASGWLVVVERARQHRATRYRLTTPGQQCVSRIAPTHSALPSSASRASLETSAVREGTSSSARGDTSSASRAPEPLPNQDRTLPPAPLSDGGSAEVEPETGGRGTMNREGPADALRAAGSPGPQTTAGPVPIGTAQQLQAAGVPADRHSEVVALADADPTTRHGGAGRIAASEAYARTVWHRLQDQDRAAAETRRQAQPPCPEHAPQRQGSCSSCAGDHKAHEHDDAPSPHCHLCAAGNVVQMWRTA